MKILSTFLALISLSVSAIEPLHLPLELSFEESQKAYNQHLKLESKLLDKKNKNFDNLNFIADFSAYESDMQLALKSGAILGNWMKMLKIQIDLLHLGLLPEEHKEEYL